MVVTPDRVSLLALLRFKDVSWYLAAREAQRPEGLERLLEGRPTEVSDEAAATAAVIRERTADLPRFIEEVRALLDRTGADGIGLTTVMDSDYPANLRTIYNLPPFLFYRGDLFDDDARAVAVVGTRRATVRGLEQARELARMLADAGVTVLSGLARGIDTEAHAACLDAGGRTIAVLGSGIYQIYPPENADLAERITASGAVVSQFWPDAAPTRYSFPRRNVVTSGLGQGTVVVEASATSGAKMQARLAMEHGKRVFLLRSLVQEHEWARKYAARGAVVVDSIEDIVSALRSPAAVRDQAVERQQLSLAI